MLDLAAVDGGVPCSCCRALLQSVGEGARRRPVGSAELLGCFELEPLADKLDRFGQDMGTETEGALDDAGLAAGDCQEFRVRAMGRSS